MRTVNTPMRFRKLRIGWSVVWGMLAVLLIVLWVRSYSWCDNVVGPLGATRSFCIWSDKGHLGISLVPQRLQSLADGGPWASGHAWMGDASPRDYGSSPWLPSWSTENYVVAPIWLLEPLIVAIAALPWIHWSKRFSVRTLIIATTLVAVVLGLIVYAVRATHP
jgi:hypothetical protein